MTKKFKLTPANKRAIQVFNETGGVEGCAETVSFFKELYLRLKKELGREPTATDLDNCVYTPSSRLLQRYFKEGVVGFRKFIGVKVTDLTKGATRSRVMNDIFKVSKEYEASLFMEMYKKLNRENEVIVLREYCYQQWFDDKKLDFFHGNFSDVAVITGDHVQLFDFTNPASAKSLGGCVRTKLNKLIKQPIAFRPEVTYEVFFVCVNPDITQEMINDIPVCNREIKVYSIDTFRSKFL